MPKIGHAGTLDPFATGLLILLLGNNTKRFDEFQAYKKEYVATIRFGIETETYEKMVRLLAGMMAK
jgi:tRNA pseudouridine55 synthase